MSKLVTITSFTDTLEANIVKGRLKAESIPAFLADENHINANLFMSNALGGVKLKVPSEYEQQARAIIKTIVNDQSDTNSENNNKKIYSNRTIMLSIMVTAIAIGLLLVFTGILFP